MEISRTTKAYLAAAGGSAGLVLDYASRNGELAELTGGIFADHRLYNRAPKSQSQYVARGQDITGDFSTAVLTAQFSTELNMQLAREVLSILQPNAQLFILLPAGYAIQPYTALPCIERISLENGGEQIIALRRDESFIDASERVTRYVLNTREEQLSLEAGPGVFSPEKLDLGTKALLDVLQFSGGRVLDLACGNGVMGIWAAVNGASEVTMLDADLRAVKCAQRNAALNGVVAEVVPGDALTAQGWRERFDYILCNPPYHSDYAVARDFIEGGFKALSVGGSLWLVVKNPKWYREKMSNVFGGARVIEKDGYAVVMGEKRGEQRTAQTNNHKRANKTTRKHEKRMARVSKGK